MLWACQPVWPEGAGAMAEHVSGDEHAVLSDLATGIAHEFQAVEVEFVGGVVRARPSEGHVVSLVPWFDACVRDVRAPSASVVSRPVRRSGAR